MKYKHGTQVEYKGYILKYTRNHLGYWAVLDTSTFPARVVGRHDYINEARKIADEDLKRKGGEKMRIMENEKMKMVMMNKELYMKYANAARTKIINKMRAKYEEKGEKMNPLAELSEAMTITIFVMEFGKLLFDSGSDEECEE